MSKLKTGLLFHYFNSYVAFLIFILLGVLLLQHFYILPGYKSSLEKVAISKIETLVDNMDHIIDNLESFAY